MSLIYMIKPLHIVAKMFGLVPFSIGIYSKNGLIYPKISVIDLIWFLIILTTNLIIIIILICNTFRVTDIKMIDGSYMYRCLKMILIFDLIFVCFCGISDLINRFIIVQIMNEFRQIDKKVSSDFDINQKICTMNLLTF